MELEQIREYCLAKKHVTEDMPFGDGTLCYRVMDKIFLLANISSKPLRINLKCDPENAEALRDKFENVVPSYHMNKKHWNTIIIDHSLKSSYIKEWIDWSYQLIVASLPKSIRKDFEN